MHSFSKGVDNFEKEHKSTPLKAKLSKRSMNFYPGVKVSKWSDFNENGSN